MTSVAKFLKHWVVSLQVVTWLHVVVEKIINGYWMCYDQNLTQSQNCNEAKVSLAVFSCHCIVLLRCTLGPECVPYTHFSVNAVTSARPARSAHIHWLRFKTIYCMLWTAVPLLYTQQFLFLTKTQWFDYRIGDIFNSLFFSIFWFSCVKCFNLTNLQICFHLQLIANYVNSKKLFQNIFLSDLLSVNVSFVYLVYVSIYLGTYVNLLGERVNECDTALK